MNELRLFLLNTPLLPGMELPLQVFEPRYHQLIRECRGAGEPFGVALIREGVEVGGDAEPYTVGTTAEIRLVAPIAQGRLLVRTLGRRRFRILELHRDRPYLWAAVEYPADEASDVPATLAAVARERFAELARLRAAAKLTYERAPEVPDEPGALADAIGAAAAGIAPGPALQRIVEAIEVRERLELSNELLTGVLEVAHDRARSAVAAHWAAPERLN